MFKYINDKVKTSSMALNALFFFIYQAVKYQAEIMHKKSLSLTLISTSDWRRNVY